MPRKNVAIWRSSYSRPLGSFWCRRTVARRYSEAVAGGDLVAGRWADSIRVRGYLVAFWSDNLPGRHLEINQSASSLVHK
jgi:hypothetical protein